MRFGLDVAQQRLEWSEILERARLAESLGFDGIWLFDHFKPMYGEGPGPCFEAWTSMAALAAATERVRIGTLVTGMTYRHPSILATEAVTIDHVSNGRLELAIGAAWFEEEHRELGIPYPPNRERIPAFEEAVQVMKKLMTEDDVSFDGRYFSLDHATYQPRPVQRPHPPVWIGASGDRMLRITARHADAWHAFGTPSQVAARSRDLDRLAEEEGRDPASILRASSLSISEPSSQVRAAAEKFADAGIGYLVAGWPGEGAEKVEEFTTEVMAELRDSPA